MTSSLTQRQPTDTARTRLIRCGKCLGIALVAGVLAACADETTTRDDRRFANEPSTEAASTATVTPEIVTGFDAPSTPKATPVSPESLLATEGATDVVFDLLGDSILAIDTAAGAPPVRIASPAGWAFASIAPSPVDDRVAALLVSTDASGTGASDLIVYDRAGEPVNQWSNLPGADRVSATPATDSPTVNAAASPTISWSRDGARLLVAPGGPDLVTIDLDGQATVLAVPAPVERVEYAAWSPRDDQIALLARNEQGGAAIWVFSPYVDGVSMRQVAPPNADASNLGSVTKFRWLHDGSGFVYILSASSGSNAQGGQLYTINLKLGIRLLVATAGRGGPAAEIVDFVPSPDGRNVAYEIAIPDGDGWQFHSLWVRPVQGEGVYEAPVGQADRVDDIWWAGDGLVARQSTGEETDFVVIGPNEPPVSVLEIGPQATPAAATPVSATPAATPVLSTSTAATPSGATPVAATPVR